MSVAAEYGLTAYMLDTSNAFVGSDLDIPNYMDVPDGLEEYESIGNRTDYVLELWKSLYGFRQSANLWHRKVKAFLIKIGFGGFEHIPE